MLGSPVGSTAHAHRMSDVPHRLRHLNAWFLSGDTVWEGYGTLKRYSLAGGSLYRGQDLRVYSLTPFPVHSLYFLRMVENVISQLPCLRYPLLCLCAVRYTDSSISKKGLSS